MRLSLKTKQALGVTITVGVVVCILSLINLATLTRVSLAESKMRNEMLAAFIFRRAETVVSSREQGVEQLRTDPHIRDLLDSTTAYERNVSYAAIVDAKNVVVAYSPEPDPDVRDPQLRARNPEGQMLEPQSQIDELLEGGIFSQLQGVLSDRPFEVQLPMFIRREPFGTIRIGVSTLLIWQDLKSQLQPTLWIALAALVVAVVVSMVFSNWMLRPIHVLKAGLARLGKGEEGVQLDLPPGDEFADLGSSFNILSAELSAVRAKLAGHAPGVESVVDQLEDAVAVVNTKRELVFANAAFRSNVPGLADIAEGETLADDFPYRRLVARVLETGEPQGPLAIDVPAAEGTVQQSVTAHPLSEATGRPMGVMVVARNLSYLSWVENTLSYSRKLAALNRLLASVAHEVKNPLNAMTIHLELLKQKLRASGGELGAEPAAVDVPPVMPHVSIISMEIRRLDEVVQGFLKFSRPEELLLQPVELHGLLQEVSEVMGPQAHASGVTIVNECEPTLPKVSGDRGMLRQAFLNLALNACQAMPQGGVLRFAAVPDGSRFVVVEVADTGVGIRPEHMEKLFDLYFSTKDKGSGLGLSMVYRTVHLHNGSIEVESVPGSGATFRLRLPRAEVPARQVA
ncbi:MAG: HAMP domain-containing protein [Luteitalea sp.]|nr:HAMP domain-containing protein [Luteitalea sp.]